MILFNGSISTPYNILTIDSSGCIRFRILFDGSKSTPYNILTIDSSGCIRFRILFDGSRSTPSLSTFISNSSLGIPANNKLPSSSILKQN